MLPIALALMLTRKLSLPSLSPPPPRFHPPLPAAAAARHLCPLLPRLLDSLPLLCSFAPRARPQVIRLAKHQALDSVKQNHASSPCRTVLACHPLPICPLSFENQQHQGGLLELSSKLGWLLITLFHFCEGTDRE